VSSDWLRNVGLSRRRLRVSEGLTGWCRSAGSSVRTLPLEIISVLAGDM